MQSVAVAGNRGTLSGTRSSSSVVHVQVLRVGAGARTWTLLQFDVGVGGAMMSRWRVEEGKSSSLGWRSEAETQVQKVGLVGHRRRRKEAALGEHPLSKHTTLHAAR